MDKGLSVIICTYNGVDKILPTIQHLAKQQINNVAWEVILADNGSMDGTAELATLEWQKHVEIKAPLKVIKETQPGKYFALQKAIEKAKYEFLIICDDDNWLEENYLSIVYEQMSNNEDIAALGGYGIPVTSGDPLPEWLEEYKPAYAIGPQALKNGPLRPGKFLWGAGLATRKSVYQEMYSDFPTSLLAVNDVKALSAEDTEYCLRLILKGYQLYYNDQLIYRHHLSDERLTVEYRKKLFNNFAKSNEVLQKYHSAVRVKIKAHQYGLKPFFMCFEALFKIFFSFNSRKEIFGKDTLYFLLSREVFKVDAISKSIKNFYS